MLYHAERGFSSLTAASVDRDPLGGDVRCSHGHISTHYIVRTFSFDLWKQPVWFIMRRLPDRTLWNGTIITTKRVQTGLFIWHQFTTKVFSQYFPPFISCQWGTTNYHWRKVLYLFALTLQHEALVNWNYFWYKAAWCERCEHVGNRFFVFYSVHLHGMNKQAGLRDEWRTRLMLKDRRGSQIIDWWQASLLSYTNTLIILKLRAQFDSNAQQTPAAALHSAPHLPAHIVIYDTPSVCLSAPVR